MIGVSVTVDGIAHGRQVFHGMLMFVLGFMLRSSLGCVVVAYVGCVGLMVGAERCV